MSSVVPEAAVGHRPGNVAEAARLGGKLKLPSDKSVAHRALLFNAMASGEARVSLYRPGDDVQSTIEVLRQLGGVHDVADDGAGNIVVSIRGGGQTGAARLPGSGGETLDCGNSGTAMRLLAGALSGRPGRATLTGDDSLSVRPMERIAAPLRDTGVSIATADGHAPLVIDGQPNLRAVRHELPVASAQVVGCLALAGLAAEGTTIISVPGPTRDHSERMLAWLGVPIRREGLTTTLTGPAGFEARSMVVPGDISSAAAWLVAGALHPDANISLIDVGLNPSRTAVIEVLREMGADIMVSVAPGDEGPEPIGTITVRGGRPLRAIDISGSRVADLIDELPLISVAMAAADGISEVHDAAELRVKESDRIALVVSNLAAIGADVEELSDGWRVRRGTPRAASITTAADHRIAMAFAIAALTGVAGPVEIDDPSCAAVSYPTFWSDMESLAR